MRKDDSDLERMTTDLRNDWFPHPSPDEKSVLYLSYAAGTEGHLHNKQVKLRLFSLDYGNSLKLLSLYGWQGAVKCSQLEQEREVFFS